MKEQALGKFRTGSLYMIFVDFFGGENSYFVTHADENGFTYNDNYDTPQTVLWENSKHWKIEE